VGRTCRPPVSRHAPTKPRAFPARPPAETRGFRFSPSFFCRFLSFSACLCFAIVVLLEARALGSLTYSASRPARERLTHGGGSLSPYRSLSPAEKTKVESKIAALCVQTGRSWDYQVLDTQGQSERPPLLEITVDGTISRPIQLPESVDCPGEILCREFDQYAAQQAGGAGRF
jgi:hypothetical protein